MRVEICCIYDKGDWGAPQRKAKGTGPSAKLELALQVPCLLPYKTIPFPYIRTGYMVSGHFPLNMPTYSCACRRNSTKSTGAQLFTTECNSGFLVK